MHSEKNSKFRNLSVLVQCKGKIWGGSLVIIVMMVRGFGGKGNGGGGGRLIY
jgi:hypothetical protein